MGARLSNSYLLGEALIGVVFGTILLLSMVMSPSTEALSLFGFDVPVMCMFRRWTGMGCPGCGLTRSFTFMAHGDPIGAFQMNYLGPFLFTIFATQPPYRAYTIGRELLARRRAPGIPLEDV